METLVDRGIGELVQEGELGQDLLLLTQQVGSPLRRIHRLTTLPSAALSRASFRIQFENGLTLKGRRFSTEEHSRRAYTFLEQMPRRHFPGAVGHRGLGLLTEWKTGRPLTREQIDPTLIAACGRLLSEIHQVHVPGMATTVRPVGSLEEEEALANDLGRLVTLGGLTATQASRLTALAVAAIPAVVETGTVHLDFCPPNLLLDETDRIVVIDNESLCFEAFDYSLARCWYRWPMNAGDRRAFLDGYAFHRSPETFLAHQPYWLIRAATASALFRLANDTFEKETPLRALKSFLRNADGRIQTQSIT